MPNHEIKEHLLRIEERQHKILKIIMDITATLADITAGLVTVSAGITALQAQITALQSSSNLTPDDSAALAAIQTTVDALAASFPAPSA